MSSPSLIAPLAAAWQHNDAIRFGASGILGNAIFFGLDKILFPVIVRAAVRLSTSDRSAIVVSGSTWINENAASVSFFVAYLLDIAVQHLLNAWLVFGLDTISTRELYISSLTTSYTAYFGTLCGSTILQAYLLQCGISKSVAFWSTIALGSLVNYVVLTSLNAVDKTTDEKVTTKNDTNFSSGKMAMVPIWGAKRAKIDLSDSLFTNFAVLSGSESQLGV
mmetsp:Transcript_4557/g.10302  ORF Transcript_4557/g.10302 Transcript_4557/m.10302 type:complete len:221 (-) Transcript_4557:1829-2491(-)